MNDKKDGSTEFLRGTSPLDPKELEDFERAMSEEVIPDIVKIAEERRLLVAQSRQRHLKC